MRLVRRWGGTWVIASASTVCAITGVLVACNSGGGTSEVHDAGPSPVAVDAAADRRAPPPEPGPDGSLPPSIVLRIWGEDNRPMAEPVTLCVVGSSACCTTESSECELVGFPLTNFTLMATQGSAKVVYPADGRALDEISRRPGVLLTFNFVPFSRDGGAPEPGTHVVVHQQIGPSTPPRNFDVSMSPSSGVTLERSHDVAFAGATPGKVVLTGRSRGDAGACSKQTFPAFGINGWATADPTAVEALVVEGATLYLEGNCR